MSSLYPRVLITDETLRDGFQVERPGITVEDKLRVAALLVEPASVASTSAPSSTPSGVRR